MTAFTESVFNAKFQAVIGQEERLLLSEQEFQKFVEVLDNPPVPTSALVEARRKLRKIRAENSEGNW